MDLPHISKQHDSIWVTLDIITNSAHVLDVKTTDLAENYTKIHINKIYRLQKVSFSVISDISPYFNFHLWKSFKKGVGSHTYISITFHL